MNQQVLQINQQRCSVKSFDATKKISEDTIMLIREIFRLTPSAVNGQGWKMIVVESQEMREKLRTAAWEHNGPRFDASHILVFCKKDMTEEHCNAVHESNMKISGMSSEDYAGRRAFVNKFMSGELIPRNDWEEKQVYLALGYMIANLAMLGIDSCPMEGFWPADFDKVLGLETSDIHSVVSMAIGIRSDKFTQGKKMRLSVDETSEVI